MATAKELAMIIEAVKRLAHKNEDVRTSVNAHALRGDIPESEVRADIADSQDECCAEKGNGGGGNDGPCDTPASEIWCQPDEPWTDCSTGKPIRVWPGGFPQAEGCKDCLPDEDWEEGHYWYSSLGGSGSTPDPLLLSTVSYWEASYNGSASWRNVTCTAGSSSYGVLTAGNETKTLEVVCVGERNIGGTWVPNSEITPESVAIKYECGASLEGYCTETEAPDKCGETWEQDELTDLGIIEGCITASSCDPDATSADQKCKTCQDMCQGAKKIRVCAKPHTGGFTVEDPSNPGYGSSYDRYGNKLYDYNPLGG